MSTVFLINECFSIEKLIKHSQQYLGKYFCRNNNIRHISNICIRSAWNMKQLFSNICALELSGTLHENYEFLGFNPRDSESVRFRYMFVYIHMYLHICRHAHILISHIYVCVYICVHMCTYVHMHICKSTHK